MHASPISILVVDDRSTVRLHLGRLLTRAGYSVSIVESGRGALAAYELNRPDLVVLDIVMDDMDGIETLRALQRIDPRVKVLGISGLGPLFSALYLETLQKLGATATLEKPFRDEVFLHVVRQLTDTAHDPGAEEVA